MNALFQKLPCLKIFRHLQLISTLGSRLPLKQQVRLISSFQSNLQLGGGSLLLDFTQLDKAHTQINRTGRCLIMNIVDEEIHIFSGLHHSNLPHRHFIIVVARRPTEDTVIGMPAHPGLPWQGKH